MPPIQSKVPFYRKKVFLIVVSIVFIAGIALGAVGVLRNVKQTPAPVAVASVIDTSTIVTSYKTSFLAANSTYIAADSQNDAYIRYTADKSYAVDILAKNSIVLSTKSVGVSSDSAAIKAQTAAFFKKENLSEITQTQNVVGLTYSTYGDSNRVCQLKSIEGTKTSNATHTFACSTKASTDSEYKTVTQLIALIPKTMVPTSYSQALRTSISSGTKEISLLTIGTPPLLTQVAFVRVSTDWKYAAVLSQGDSSLSNGKFVPSDELTKAFKDPDYGTFLHDTLFGNSK